MSTSNSTTGAKVEKVWYDANCHCGNVKYKIKLDDLEHPEGTVNSCNCSICTKNGYILVYPSVAEVEWLSGYDTLKDYRFGKKRFDQKFCLNCGSSILIDFHNPGKVAMNVIRILATII